MLQSIPKTSTNDQALIAFIKKAEKKPDFNPRDVNFAMIVMQFMVKYGLGPIEKLMSDMAKLEKLLAQFQGDFGNIAQLLSMLEKEAKSGKGFWKNGKGGFGPGAFNGLPKNFWNGHKSQLKEFMNEIKSIFFAGSDKSTPTLADLMKEFGGGNLEAYFKKISGEFNDPSDPKHKVITTDPKQHVSLLQLFIFLKLKVSADEKALSHSPIPKDLTKLFDPNPKSGSDDPIISSLLSFFANLKTPVTAKRKDGSEKHFGNLLEAIKSGNLDQLGKIFGAMAFNYFWSKNPNYDEKDPKPPSPGPGYHWKNDPGVADGDFLSTLYSSTSSVQTLISSSSNEEMTTMQEYSSEGSRYQNIGQNMIEQVFASEKAMVHNDLSN